MRAIRNAWELVLEYRGAYLLLNLAFYGLMAAAMAYVAFFYPALQKTVWNEVGEAFRTGTLEAVVGAYSGGQVLRAAAPTAFRLPWLVEAVRPCRPSG